MVCHRLSPTGFICLGNIKFSCPYCGKEYLDDNEKYLNRCNKNDSGCTIIKCGCGRTFGMTYNYKGDAQAFK